MRGLADMGRFVQLMRRWRKRTRCGMMNRSQRQQGGQPSPPGAAEACEQIMQMMEGSGNSSSFDTMNGEAMAVDEPPSPPRESLKRSCSEGYSSDLGPQTTKRTAGRGDGERSRAWSDSHPNPLTPLSLDEEEQQQQSDIRGGSLSKC
jgi:hypothetical protein